MITHNFAVFILSHGRPNKVVTYNSLLKAGYTGKIYIIIDNEDKTKDEYYKKFGNIVLEFNKTEFAKQVNTSDNFNNRKAIVYARNWNFIVAKQLGIKYFLQLDDDYKEFSYRIDNKLSFNWKYINQIDNIFNAFISFLIKSKIKSVAFFQNGDFLGGKQSSEIKNDIHSKRKCMNTWFFDVDNPVTFFGTLNEDYTASVYYGMLGDVFLSVPLVAIGQIATQKAKGGMSDTYAQCGTYLKTFYSVMVRPSCVKVGIMGMKHKRLHHHTLWNNAVPKIIDEKYKIC